MTTSSEQFCGHDGGGGGKIFPTKANEMDVTQLIGCVMGHNMSFCWKTASFDAQPKNTNGLHFVVMPKTRNHANIQFHCRMTIR